jgi:uncharacterized membrane-anchored protein YjiN (DUF445 family)
MQKVAELPEAQKCAAYMAAIRTNIIDLMDDPKYSGRIVLLKYEQMKNDLIEKQMFPPIMWSTGEKLLMRKAAEPYSKARGNPRAAHFEDDSGKKQDVADEAMKYWAEKYMGPLQRRLDAKLALQTT